MWEITSYSPYYRLDDLPSGGTFPATGPEEVPRDSGLSPSIGLLELMQVPILEGLEADLMLRPVMT